MTDSKDIYDVISLASPADRQKLKGYIDAAVQARHRIKMEQEAIKDVRTEAKENLNVTPRMFTKLVRTIFTDSVSKEKAEAEEYEAVIELVYPEAVTPERTSED